MLRRPLFLLPTLVLSCATLFAQKDNRDEAAIHDYVLTMPRVQVYAAAVKDYSASGSKVQETSECKKFQDDDNMALVDKAKHVESDCPTLNTWIKQHGMTAKEFVILPMTLITAGLASATVDRSGKPPAFVNPANITFVKNHKDELEKMNLGSGNSND